MIKKKSSRPVTIKIDLTGPEGNAYVLMGYAKRLAGQIGLKHEPIIKDMMSGNYEHLIQVFEKHFGKYVVMYR